MTELTTPDVKTVTDPSSQEVTNADKLTLAAEAFASAEKNFDTRWDEIYSEGSVDGLVDAIDELVLLRDAKTAETTRIVTILQNQDREKWEGFMNAFAEMRKKWTNTYDQYFSTLGYTQGKPIPLEIVERRDAVIEKIMNEGISELITNQLGFKAGEATHQAITEYLFDYKKNNPIPA